jgi:hypothetical protein
MEHCVFYRELFVGLKGEEEEKRRGKRKERVRDREKILQRCIC